MSSNVLNQIEIREIRGVLMAFHFKLFSNRNTPLLMKRSIVLHYNRHFHIPK